MEKQRSNWTERSFDIQVRSSEAGAGENENGELWIEGYAAIFNSPTVLFKHKGVEYKEQIKDTAFESCNMQDVVFNYNHGGKVIARTRNKTLFLTVDSKGLFIRARLDGTEEGRKLYEEIKGGYIDKMSFRFLIKEESLDEENHMWTIHSIEHLYDVSAVDFPAYDDTSVSARKSMLEEDEEKRERLLKQKLLQRRLKTKIKLSMKEEGNK